MFLQEGIFPWKVCSGRQSVPISLHLVTVTTVSIKWFTVWELVKLSLSFVFRKAFKLFFSSKKQLSMQTVSNMKTSFISISTHSVFPTWYRVLHQSLLAGIFYSESGSRTPTKGLREDSLVSVYNPRLWLFLFWDSEEMWVWEFPSCPLPQWGWRAAPPSPGSHPGTSDRPPAWAASCWLPPQGDDAGVGGRDHVEHRPGREPHGGGSLPVLCLGDQQDSFCAITLSCSAEQQTFLSSL